MSNERIDLTSLGQEELREKLFDWMTKDYNANQFIDNTGEYETIDEIFSAIEHLGLFAELKRCYEEIDRLNHAAHTCDDCGGHRESINDCENVCYCPASE